MKRFLALAAVLSVLAACSSGPPVVPAKQVSKEAETQLRQQNSQIAPGTMKCPELVGEAGRKIRCVRSVHVGIWDATIKGTVTVTKVEGGTVNFDVSMDKHIATYAADRKTNETIVADAFKVDRKSVSCPDPISGKVGSVGYCVGTEDDGTKRKLKLTVSKSDLNAGVVNYNIQVVD